MQRTQAIYYAILEILWKAKNRRHQLCQREHAKQQANKQTNNDAKRE